MNDGIYHPQSPERMQAFQDGVRKLIAATHSANARLILITPPPFDPLPVASRVLKADAPDFSFMKPYEAYDQVLADYARWEQTLPPDQVLAVADCHAALSAYVNRRRQKDPAFRLSGDGIHPSPSGHLLIAQTVLKATGLDLETPDLDQELSKIQADPPVQTRPGTPRKTLQRLARLRRLYTRQNHQDRLHRRNRKSRRRLPIPHRRTEQAPHSVRSSYGRMRIVRKNSGWERCGRGSRPDFFAHLLSGGSRREDPRQKRQSGSTRMMQRFGPCPRGREGWDGKGAGSGSGETSGHDGSRVLFAARWLEIMAGVVDVGHELGLERRMRGTIVPGASQYHWPRKRTRDRSTICVLVSLRASRA